MSCTEKRCFHKKTETARDVMIERNKTHKMKKEEEIYAMHREEMFYKRHIGLIGKTKEKLHTENEDIL
jgi:hypothetical protein